MDKPNLERLSLIFAPHWAPKSNELLPIVTKNWEEISEGKKSYPDLPLLESFLEENGLFEMFPDFQFMAFTFNKWNEFNEFLKPRKGLNKGQLLELFTALKMFLEYKEGITLTLKHSKYKVQTEIKNEFLIKLIYESLHKYCREIDEEINSETPNFDNVTDLAKYFDKRIKEVKPKAGRKSGNHHLRRCIYHLWKYLQENTDIRAMEGAGYSNSQARFIFSFLNICGMIENADQISNKEDFVRNHLIAYLNIHKKLIPPLF